MRPLEGVHCTLSLTAAPGARNYNQWRIARGVGIGSSCLGFFSFFPFFLFWTVTHSIVVLTSCATFLRAVSNDKVTRTTCELEFISVVQQTASSKPVSAVKCSLASASPLIYYLFNCLFVLFVLLSLQNKKVQHTCTSPKNTPDIRDI